jgi:hypothetical protein
MKFFVALRFLISFIIVYVGVCSVWGPFPWFSCILVIYLFFSENEV